MLSLGPRRPTVWDNRTSTGFEWDFPGATRIVEPAPANGAKGGGKGKGKKWKGNGKGKGKKGI